MIKQIRFLKSLNEYDLARQIDNYNYTQALQTLANIRCASGHDLI
jgi:hypothetical protein